jgi:hypothetical protein
VFYKSLPNLPGEGRRRRIALGLAAAALVVLATTPSRAGTLDIVVQDSTAAPGTLGQFDIDLVNNSTSAVAVAAFSVDVLLTDITNVVFTAIDNATTAPYIFSVTGSFPPGFQSNLLPMEAAGNDRSNGAQVVKPGDTWGLAEVTYLVDPSAPLGTVVPVALELTPVFLPPPGGTSLTNPRGGPQSFNSVNGTITVQNPMVVPEPSTVILLTVSSLTLLSASRLSRRGRPLSSN